MAIASVVGFLVGSGLTIAAQAALRLSINDVARRISATVWGIRAFDFLTSWFPPMRDALWSGTWKVTWAVDSENFVASNQETVRIYRCFNNIALEGSGTTISGDKIPYGFVGKLTRDKSILTGIWFDRGGSGYHGVFQLRVQGTGNRALGLWAGFSETSAAIKSGELDWVRTGGSAAARKLK